MSELLRADFRRVFKDKLLLVIGILAVVFALITPLLYVVLLSGSDMLSSPIYANLLTSKSLFFQSFSIGNNLGLIVPVLLAIVLCKDFSYGTVRNKIIAGKSRSEIFLSLFTVCSVTLIAVMLFHAFITLAFSLLFFDYQTTAFTMSDFYYFLQSIAFEILVLLFVAALLSWLCAVMKNVGLVIVLYVAISFALVMIGSATQIALSVFDTIGENETTRDIIYFIDRINVGNATSYIGMGTTYTFKDVLYLTLPQAVGIFGFLGFGLLKFKRKDLK